MNKKFFTLLVAFLATISSGAFAQVLGAPIDFTGNGVTTTVGAPQIVTGDVTNGDGGYARGKSYYLGDGTKFLQVATRTNHELHFDALGTSLNDSRLALWTLQELNAPEGSLYATYVFINEYAGVTLAMEKSKAVDLGAPTGHNYQLGGDVDEWLNAPSYKNPILTSMTYTLPNDSALALLSDPASSGDVRVFMAKMKRSEVDGAAGLVKVQPYKAGTGKTVTLSPAELNTMLVENLTPTADSYFRLQFSDEPTMNGGPNLFEVDLQAVAVRQFEVAYGKKPSEASSIIVPNGTANLFTSLYPLSENWVAGAPGVAKFEDWRKKTDPSFKSGDAQWVALKNREGKYLVVDTEVIRGTEQESNPRMTFAFVDLYNAKNNTRFRDPRSYLFKFDYDPVAKSLEIISLAYVKAKTTPVAVEFDEQAFYAGNYQTQPKQKGDEWYSDAANVEVYDATANPLNNYVVRAGLLGVNEVTVGAYTPAAKPTNKFVIKLGSSYKAASFARGAYLLKVTSSSDKSRVGKFYVKNLKGGFEIVEQAKRQEFQNMPAAQWVLTATRTTVGSPVKFVNREFPFVTYNEVEKGVLEGILYTVEGGESNEAFFINSSDTLAFIKVTKPSDEYLGYKYVAADTILLSEFKFEYLHELQMNRPLDVADNEVVMVKSDEGQGALFAVEKAVDDTYGFDGKISGLANLKRTVYKIYENGSFKVQDKKEYLMYDADLKKYVVREESDDEKANLFFLKENNYADGKSYYTFVRANTLGLIEAKEDAGAYTENTNSVSTLVTDKDLDGYFIAGKGKFKNPLTGVETDDKADIILGYDTDQEAKEEIAARGYSKIAVSQAYTNSYGDPKFGIMFVKDLPDADGNLWDMDTYYADLKASVDVNTLELVNGVLNNNSELEVATSAFAATKNDDPLYRTLGVATGETYDENLVKFFRVNNKSEFLYEDANSEYSAGKGLNFLGVEGKGDVTKPTMWTKYIPNKAKVMPQYVIAVDIDKTPAVAGVPCPDHGWDCEHAVQGTPEIVDGRFLINYQDSVNVYEKAERARFQWNTQYTRLGFVPARLIGDTLIIDNSIYTGNNKVITIGKPETWASKDTIDLSKNTHKNVVFQFRIAKTGTNDFLIESESWKDKDPLGGGVAPIKGGWVKIQNGVPVIANTTYSENGMDAEIFNLEVSTENPTSNEGIEAGDVKVIAGTGTVTIKGAAGKQVVVANILGQVVVNQVLTSDEATIAAPAGVVVVSVDGVATKALVK